MDNYNSLKSRIILASKGAAMGVADIIPGVSGGTIAFISGIYEHLIAAIYSVKLVHLISFLKLLIFFWHSTKRRQALASLREIHWNFLLTLGTGLIVAALFMANIIPWLLETYPFYMYALFFGLIAASIPVVYAKMDKNLYGFVILAIFCIGTYLFMGYTGTLAIQPSNWNVFWAGFVAISAMILPGISGSAILVILGQYTIILNALKSIQNTIIQGLKTADLDLLASIYDMPEFYLIIFFILGVATGIFTFIRLLRYLLDKYHQETMASLVGIMIGSLRKIWPYNHLTETEVQISVLVSGLIVAVLGAIVIVFLNRLSLEIGDPEPPSPSTK